MSNLYLLIIIFFSLFSIQNASTVFCNGVLCENSCSNCDFKYKCDPLKCLPNNNCFCASRNIPGNLPLSETPQFIILTLDDSFNDRIMPNIKDLDFILKNDQIKDKNQCYLRPSIYYLLDNSDYHYAKYFESFGGTVGLHTTTHTSDIFKGGKDRWIDELSNNYKALIELALINDITGSRAPYLNPDNDYFQTLLDMGIKYDSSLKDGEYYWPFTLNYGVPYSDICTTSGECPNKAFNGLWEFPIYNIKDKYGNNYATPMDPPSTNDTLSELIADFERTYSSNRVPRGLYLHPQYFTVNSNYATLDAKKVDLFVGFYKYVAQKPNVLFATETMIIEWMKNPLSFSKTKDLPQFKCPQYKSSPSNACSVVQCQSAWVKTCCLESSCPDVLPRLGMKTKSESRSPTPTPTPNPDYPENTVVINGKAKISIDSNWNTGLCGTFHVSHSNTDYIAKSMLIIFKICDNKFYGESIWSNKFKKSSDPAIYQTIINYQGVSYNADKEYVPTGFCLNYLNEFDISKMMASIEFYDQYLLCDERTCKPKCGDGICDSKSENEINCQVDCLKC